MLKSYCAAFNQPVNPIALNIPDYFLIVKRPMDLATVRDKLRCTPLPAYRNMLQFAEVSIARLMLRLS